MEREEKILNQLITNNAALQSASLKLIENMKDLTTRIDKLVKLFEEASKHVGEVEVTDDKLKALVAKLDMLLDQNKDVAKGLILLEKYIRGRSEFETSLNPKPLSSVGNF